ncbi:MAG: ATPase domain-containing protein [Candidatus Diapherotrites archaeon]
MDERTKTGIEGLDKALNGGVPKRNIVLVSGGAGTGKSTLAMQFLVNGAKLFGEKGLYISTEQQKKELYRAAESYGWDLESLETNGLIKIVYFDVVETDGFLEKLYELYTTFMPKRVVIDSLTTLTDSLLVSGMGEKEAFSMVQIAESVSPIPRTERIVSKTLLYHLMKKLRLFDSTIMLTSELLEGEKGLSADQISEFICDGVLMLHYLGIAGADLRTMQIRKMRYTEHIKSYLPYTIVKNKGLDVDAAEAMDVLMK